MKTLLLPLAIFAALPALAQTITTGASLPNGILNQPYSTQLSCTNCQGFTYGFANGATALPPGLNLSPGGTISGVPGQVGTYTFQIGLYAQGNPEPFGARTFSITIPSGLQILNTSFPNGSLGVPYSQALSATGGITPYTWAITQGALPNGLGIANNNSIVGTPTALGTFNFTLSVFDAQQNGAFINTSITIAGGTNGPSITTPSLPNGIVAVAYNTQLACNNCAGYLWSLSSGNLPLGLNISSGGAISGTPTVTGTSSFQITLSPPPGNPSGTTPQSISQIYTITITAAGLGITQTTIPIAFAGTPYSTTLTGTGGLTPYTWTFPSSTGNNGLTIGASTGTISGTPIANGTFILNVMLADSSGLTLTKQFTLTVSTGLSVLTTSLPNGSVGTVYPTQQLSAGGGQPPYRWAVTAGKLPPGLTLDGVFGRISGTPTANGNYPFTLTVTDNQANTATGSLSITIGAGVTITISPATLTAGAVGTAYSQAFTATGGTAPYTWTLVTPPSNIGTGGGTLPPGLTLNGTTGAVTGTPTTAGTYTFTVQATDSTQATGQQAVSLTIAAAAPLSITTTTLPNGTVGTAYSQTVAATGGVTPYTWTSSGLPPGLTINASSGAITGTPTTIGSTTVTVTVTDSAKTAANKSFTFQIGPAVAPLTITTTSLPNGAVGTAYSQTVAATGGTTPYKFALSSTSNDGLTINSTTGVISGTPTTAGSFTLTVVVTDSATPAQTATQNLPLTVNAPVVTITIAPATLPAATVGTAYSQTLTATGGTSPYKFTVTTGSLPSGLSLASTGAITGTATAAATATFTVTATDANNATGTHQYTLAVNAPPPPTGTLAGVPATSGFQQQLAVTPTLSTTFPTAITGTVVLTFTPSVTPPPGSTGTIDDNMIQFSGGAGRNATFTVPAGSTTAPNLTVLTGTTAGTITLTTTLSSGGSPTTQTIVNASGVPFISKVTLQQAAGGVTVVVTGFSSTRDMTNASFVFAPATGDTFQSNNISVPVQNAFNTWYANTAQSNPFGTQFTLTIPFTLATATQSVTSVAVVSVTVTLQNSKGASNSVTLSQ